MTTTVPATAKSIWVDLLGAEVRYYDAAGIRTRSIESGTGETIIMLHGIGGHAEAFARNVVPLGEHFNARSIDYYGHGFTDYGGKPFVKDTYVRHLIDFMDAAGIKKAHLIGESLGGWIAAWAAIDYPDRVGKVIYTVGAHLKVPIDEATQAKTAAGQAELTRLSKQFMAEPNRANVHARLKWLFSTRAGTRKLSRSTSARSVSRIPPRRWARPNRNSRRRCWRAFPGRCSFCGPIIIRHSKPKRRRRRCNT